MSPAVSLTCENLPEQDKFRCLCPVGQANLQWSLLSGYNFDDNLFIYTRLNLDSFNFDNSCQDVIPEIKGYSTESKVNSQDNHVIYKLSNLNTTKHDVCLDIEYSSEESYRLKVSYDVSPLFDIALEQSIRGKTFSFCVKQFVRKVSENFELKLEMSNVNDPDKFEKPCTLKSIKLYLAIHSETPAVPFIESWVYINNTLDSLIPKERQRWYSLPKDKINPKSFDLDEIFYELSSKPCYPFKIK